MNRLDVGSQKMSQSRSFSFDKSLASDQDAGKKRRVRNIHSFQSDFHSGVSLRGRQHGCIDHAALNRADPRGGRADLKHSEVSHGF
jgi:hypothetical protein